MRSEIHLIRGQQCGRTRPYDCQTSVGRNVAHLECTLVMLTSAPLWTKSNCKATFTLVEVTRL